MPGVNTAEKVTVPAAGDTFDYLGEIRRLANSQRTIVSVANRAEGDTIAAAMAADGRPVSDANPLVVLNLADKLVEMKTSTGWQDAGRTVKHAEYQATFDIAGGSVQWDIGPLARISGSSFNDSFCNSTGALSGALNFTENGWYSLDSMTMPNGSPGNALVSMNHNGNFIITSGHTNGYMWEICTNTSLVYITAGSYVRWTTTMTTSRNCNTRVRVTKWA